MLENANLTDCEFSWWRNSVKGESVANYSEDDLIRDKTATWLRISNEHSKLFVPREEDIGRKLMVRLVFIC